MQKIIKLIFYLFCAMLIYSCSNHDDISISNELNIFDSLHENDSSSVEFFVISDWGEMADSNQTAGSNSMGKLSKSVLPDFIISCGDNFQFDGVQSINDKQWQIAFEDVYNYPDLQVKWYAALGNHDYNGNPEAEIAYSSISKKWCMPSYYYSFIYRLKDSCSVRFIVLDTPGLINEFNSLSDSISPNQIKQISWLDSILVNNKERWTIVIGHYPIFSASYYHGNTNELIEVVKPILEQNKVDLYISGHDHDFEHIKVADKKPEYIVTGTGSELRSIEPNSLTKFCISELGFTSISINYSNINIQFINTEGKSVYKTLVYK
jgi:tartrate-resistant acid phosphatase type 5